MRCWWWVVLEDLKTQDNSKVRLSRLNPELIFGPGRSVENYTSTLPTGFSIFLNSICIITL